MSRRARILASALRAARRNGSRTFFMMLGTFTGVAALTVLVALGRGTQEEVLRRVEQMLSGSSIILRAGGGQMRAGAHGAGPATTLTLRDLARIDSLVPAVEQVDPMSMVRATVVYDGRSADLVVEGHSEVAESVWNRSVTRGSFLSADDIASAARVALVGERVVDDLFEGRDPVGEQIRIGNSPYRVIGVLERAGMDPHGLDKDAMIMIPITTMMRRILNVDYVNLAKLGMTPGSDLDMAVLDIADVLRREHALAPGVPNDFAMFTPVQVQQSVREANRTFTLFLPLVACIAIIVGGIVTANLLFMTVHDRRAEIGVRRAVGAHGRDIRLQFLAEAAAITTIGGVAAIGAGYVVVRILAMHQGGTAHMPWAAAAIGLAVSFGVGLLAGLAPAARAARIDPVHALR